MKRMTICYEVNFDNGYYKILYDLTHAKKQVQNNEYNAKVVTITSVWLDEKGNRKSKEIKF